MAFQTISKALQKVFGSRNERLVKSYTPNVEAAASFEEGLPIAGIVLNSAAPSSNDASTATNRQEIAARSVPPILAEVAWLAERFDAEVDWFLLAGG